MSRVRFYSRILESELAEHEERGWRPVAGHNIPSMTDGVVLAEWERNGVPNHPKPDYSLIPRGIENEVATVLTIGATKHGDPPGGRAWRNLPNAEEVYYAKIRRHLDEHRNGKRKDDETGLSPLAHAIADMMIMYDIAMNNKEDDAESAQRTVERRDDPNSPQRPSDV